ncbi:nucleotidyltransferase family protein [Thermophagus xiamenensis]|uniref:Nucleotidyl transferase n=2 Tax=Thermophagus xiamenensis TaxID=385682 RepID=A0A1I2F0L9_9BACT|nr:nucleotidyltransferase family protein [Thermophagus xiamenensis]SFE98523.1 Nucleotidyl transferase [Thermophagus xiamenensis]
MNAMVFAAGLGTRLRPITNHIPKALVTVNKIPMLEYALKKLEHAGISKTVVNIHHHHEQIIDFLNNYSSTKMEILISDEKEKLLDTGGGLFHARKLFDPDTPILLYNVDILTTANLTPFIHFHQEFKPLVSMMVKKRATSRYLLFDNNMVLSGWENINTGEKITIRPALMTTPYGFQGIHIVSPEIFNFSKPDEAFSIIKLYLELGSKHIIKGYETKEDIWYDIGTPQRLEQTRNIITKLSSQELKNLF